MRHRELVLKTINFNSKIRWQQEHNHLNKTVNCERCKGRLMSITIKYNNERFCCTRCITYKSIFKNIIFYNSKNLIELLDLMYFRSLDMIQPKVAKQTNTLSHNKMWNRSDKLCIMAMRIMKKTNQYDRRLGALSPN
jgi:hypothetical protein